MEESRRCELIAGSKMYELYGRVFEVRWNRTERLWETRELDPEGNQIGDIEWSGTREWALVRVGELAVVKAAES